MANWIKSGLSVVNITNLDQILTVVKVVYKSKKVYSESEGEKRVSKIVGVECKNYDTDGKWQISLHHSKELVPLSVASKGKLESIKFVNREGEYKDY
jgi:hypothetical protein